jgi:hypothetical protein
MNYRAISLGLLIASVIPACQPPRESTAQTEEPDASPAPDPPPPVAAPCAEDKEGEEGARAKLEQIQADRKKDPACKWAGVYYEGDGLGINISFGVSPQSGAAYLWHGCTGCYGWGIGTVRQAGDYIEVAFSQQNGMNRGSERMYPVVWGRRHYLIADADMRAFCDAVNLSGEPRRGPHGWFLLRRGDEDAHATGAPLVPAQFRAWLFSKPVNAKVLSVKPLSQSRRDNWDVHTTEVTLNKGERDGIHAGTPLVPLKPRGFFEARVTSATQDQCTLTYSWQSWESRKLADPTTDWTFSTRRGEPKGDE